MMPASLDADECMIDDALKDAMLIVYAHRVSYIVYAHRVWYISHFKVICSSCIEGDMLINYHTFIPSLHTCVCMCVSTEVRHEAAAQAMRLRAQDECFSRLSFYLALSHLFTLSGLILIYIYACIHGHPPDVYMDTSLYPPLAYIYTSIYPAGEYMYTSISPTRVDAFLYAIWDWYIDVCTDDVIWWVHVLRIMSCRIMSCRDSSMHSSDGCIHLQPSIHWCTHTCMDGTCMDATIVWIHSSTCMQSCRCMYCIAIFIYVRLLYTQAERAAAAQATVVDLQSKQQSKALVTLQQVHVLKSHDSLRRAASAHLVTLALIQNFHPPNWVWVEQVKEWEWSR